MFGLGCCGFCVVSGELSRLERLDVRVAHFEELVVAMWLCVVVFLGCLRRCCCWCLVGCLQFSGVWHPASMLFFSAGHLLTYTSQQQQLCCPNVRPQSVLLFTSWHFGCSGRFFCTWSFLSGLLPSTHSTHQVADPCAVQATCINIFSSVILHNPKTNIFFTTLNNGYLGSRIDEERSELRDVV